MNEQKESTLRRPLQLSGLIIAVGIAGLFFNFLIHAELKQTALLYIGLPTIIAAIISFCYHPKSARGITMMAITIGVLLSGILFSEGIVCMIMALPLFYIVGAIGVYLFGLIRSLMSHKPELKKGGSSTLHIHVLLALPLVLMSFEGTHKLLSFERAQEVRVERHIQATSAEVEHALSQPAQFEQSLPLFLQLGFPRPSSENYVADGLELGASRIIPFVMNERDAGILHLRVSEQSPSHVRFNVEKNTTPVANWLALHETEVHWVEQENGTTTVTWIFRYERLLDPAWYFGPLERFGVAQAAEYLIEAVAMP